jgi:hypothetical protein
VDGLELVDEFRHTTDDHLLWTEAWYFDAVAPDLSWAMYACLALCPNLGRAWWWSVIVRDGEPMLLVRDQHLDLPRTFEVRGDGLWADLACHDPMVRWQVNFEGFAVALDEPGDAYTHERGDRVPVEFEFEWDAAAEPSAISDGYGQRCTVSSDFGEPVTGYRQHTWGAKDYWSREWVMCEGEDAADAVIVPRLEGGVVVESPTGERRALVRAASAIGDRVAWVEWNRAPLSL